ncbi:MAG: phosphoribosylformylglycinamidine synthase, partial [Gammaproteobacteria bacterium]
MTLHLTQFEGGNALSDFRARQLLPQLQAIHDRISTITARFVHLVACAEPPSDALRAQLTALLTYGEPYTGSSVTAADAGGPLIVVTPRFGTVSPWASKATDIAHNCALPVKRIERVTEYRLTLESPLLGQHPVLSRVQLDSVAALLHDRMTESV